jgi:hypothetical protein
MLLAELSSRWSHVGGGRHNAPARGFSGGAAMLPVAICCRRKSSQMSQDCDTGLRQPQNRSVSTTSHLTGTRHRRWRLEIALARLDNPNGSSQVRKAETHVLSRIVCYHDS